VRVLLALALLAVTARADEPPAPVAVAVHVEPQTVSIGSRFRYVVEVTSDTGTEVVVTQPSERVGDFEIVDFGVEAPVVHDGRTALARWYRLVGFAPGEHALPSPSVRWREGGELKDAPGRETHVAIESVLTADASDIRDIKPPEPIPVDWRPWYAAAAAMALVVIAGMFIRRLRRRPASAGGEPLPRLAHDVAAEALAELKRRNLVREGRFKEYYSALSDIVRTYLERQFGLRAPEMTTEEFLLTTARDARLDGVHRRLLGEFLVESDLVKFARHHPTVADSERAWDAAARFVAETSRPPEAVRAAG